MQDWICHSGGQGLVQVGCRCSVPTLLRSDPAQCQQIGWVIALTGAGFVRQPFEIVKSEGWLAFFKTTLSAGEEEAKAALTHLGVDAVQRLSVGQERERLANGAAAFRRTHQVEQWLEGLRMGTSP
jgi:hypothetical protein